MIETTNKDRNGKTRKIKNENQQCQILRRYIIYKSQIQCFLAEKHMFFQKRKTKIRKNNENGNWKNEKTKK